MSRILSIMSSNLNEKRYGLKISMCVARETPDFGKRKVTDLVGQSPE